MVKELEVSSNKAKQSFGGFEIVSATEFREGMIIELGLDGSYAEINEYFINEFKTKQDRKAGQIMLTEVYHLPTKEAIVKEIKKQLQEQRITGKVYFGEDFAELMEDCLETVQEFIKERKQK